MDEARRQHHNTFTSRHRRADGSTADVEIHSSPIRLDGRELLYSLVHDVSDRIRAEQGIRHLTQAVEQSPTSIVITDQKALLLAFARRQPVQPQPVELGEAISAMTSMLRRLIGEDIKLDWMAPDELWPKIDPSQVDQVLATSR